MLGNYNQQTYNQRKGFGPTSRLYCDGKRNENHGKFYRNPCSYLKPGETGNDDTETTFQEVAREGEEKWRTGLGLKQGRTDRPTNTILDSVACPCQSVS